MKYPIAAWSAISAFFATLLAIGAIDIFNPSDEVKFLSSILVGAITGGTIYSRERLDSARDEQRRGSGVIRVQDAGDKKVFSLELDDHPDELANKKEVTFRVVEEKKP